VQDQSLKSALYRLAASEPLLRRVRRRVAGAGVTVFMYHDIGADDAVDDAWQVVRRGDFAAQVEYLKTCYDIIDLDTALARLQSGAAGAAPRPLAVLTFDDGLRGNHTHLLPLLDALQVPATIYVATGHVESQQGYWFDRIANMLQPGIDSRIDLSAFGLGRFEVSGPPGPVRWSRVQCILAATKRLEASRCAAVAELVEAQVREQAPGRSGDAPQVLAPLSLDMLRELAAHPRVTLGVHTHGHELLPLLDIELARRTIIGARDRLLRWTGLQARHFAYPSGRSDAATRALVAQLGFASAAGTRMGVWTAADELMHIPRVSVGRYDSLATFKLNSVGGLRQWARRLMRCSRAVRA
jgi:peptidoglycan/xylan/chitin deacetylase (PgdA/CDA1 family)